MLGAEGGWHEDADIQTLELPRTVVEHLVEHCGLIYIQIGMLTSYQHHWVDKRWGGVTGWDVTGMVLRCGGGHMAGTQGEVTNIYRPARDAHACYGIFSRLLVICMMPVSVMHTMPSWPSSTVADRSSPPFSTANGKIGTQMFGITIYQSAAMMQSYWLSS